MVEIAAALRVPISGRERSGRAPGNDKLRNENLHRLAGRLADGTLRVPIQATYDLAQATDALTALATTHTQGKIAMRVA